MVGVSKVFPPQKQVLKNIYLSFFYGAKIGIIGLNGSGKSTLLKIIAGVEKEYQGEVVFSPGYSVGYLEQEPKLEPGKTVKEVVQEGVQNIVDTLKEYEEVNEKFGDPEILEDPDKMDALINRQAELQDKIDATDAWNLDSRLERAMDALRCPPEDQVVDTLSGGERRRVALCRLLLQQPDILLLDEPTNHLDAESIDWLEQHLQQYTGTVICITHDRYFLDHVAGWILELDRGEGIPWKGNYSSWLDQKTKRMAQEEKQASKRRKTLERELEWINMAPKARQAKGKARLNSYEALLNEDQKEREAKLEIFIPNGPRLGNKVIEAQHVAKAFGDKLLFDDLNFMLPPNGIVGVIGPNGAGKTTLFKMIMGMESIDKGSFEVGETVKVGYADQTHKDIDPKKTVYQVVSGGQEFIRVGGKEVNSRAYLSKFNFAGADQEKLCGVLSGGERNRLHLALTLKAEANVLLLDEPLAALDLKMRKDMQMELKEMHKSLGITFVYVTHDREEALTLSDTIVVMSEGKIQQIGTPIDIYNEPINAFVADFIGESNILNGTMIHDKLVRFCGTEFECVDEGFGENVPVDVVIRPEDLYIFPVSEMAQLVGVVETSIFKGVHYEMTVLCGGYEFLVQDYHHFEVGAEVGLLVKPFDIHIMKKERVCNTFEGKLLDATHVEFLGCNFECVPVEGIAFDTNVKVEVDFEKVILQDNEEDGTLTGEVKFILYKGDHYHLTVLSDWDENVFVDTNDVWDDGDRVGITIPPDAIRIVKITD
mgnify:CR=1 FL=1